MSTLYVHKYCMVCINIDIRPSSAYSIYIDLTTNCTQFPVNFDLLSPAIEPFFKAVFTFCNHLATK